MTAGTQHVRTFPGGRTSVSQFNHPYEMASYFDRALNKTTSSCIEEEARGAGVRTPLINEPHMVRYFILQEETWKTGGNLPLPAIPDQELHLYLGGSSSSNGHKKETIDALGLFAPTAAKACRLNVNSHKDLGSRGVSRYHAMTQVFDMVRTKPASSIVDG